MSGFNAVNPGSSAKQISEGSQWLSRKLIRGRMCDSLNAPSFFSRMSLIVSVMLSR